MKPAAETFAAQIPRKAGIRGARPLRLAAWAFVLIAVLVAAYHLKFRGELADFEVCHKAGARFLRGEPLYRTTDGHYQFKYPPVYACLISPLSALPIPWAKPIWFIVVVASVGAALWVSWRLVAPPESPGIRVVLLTGLVLAKFFGHEITLGQVNAVMVLILLVALSWRLRGREELCGAALAVAAAIKPYAVIFFPYLLVKRGFRTVAAGLCVLGAALLLPAARYGFAGNLNLLREWRRTLSLSTPTLFTSFDNVSLLAFFSRWLAPAPPAAAWIGAGLASLLLYGALLLGARRRTAAVSDVVEWAALLVFIPLFSPLGWDYTFLSATLAVMAVLAAWPRLHGREKALAAFVFLLIGASIYDVMGRRLYLEFMRLSILTPCFVSLACLLLLLRRRMRLDAATSDAPASNQ